jgi:hypothetical protein
MRRSFNLRFSCCNINICFECFEDEYVEFFKKIYSSYLEDQPTQIKYLYNTLLTKSGDQFTVSPNITSTDIQDIKDLYNIIHSIICNSICSSCNEQNLIVLHASSFIFNDKFVLLSGTKSSGKTTALLYFLINGATYTGDEIVVVSSNGIMPYQLPLRAKINTIEYLRKQFHYEFKYFSLPFGINTKKQYLSGGNNFCAKKIDDWIKCDDIIFLNEDNSKCSLKTLTEFDAMNSLLRCVRNKGSISLGLPLIKGANLYSTDFSVPLDEVKNILCG